MSQPSDASHPQHEHVMHPVAPPFLPKALRSRIARTQQRYAHGKPRPLLGYLALSTTYSVGALTLGIIARRRGEGRITTRDLLLITVATHRLSRTLAKDAVTSPMRAAFTRYTGPGLPSEVNEEVAPDREHEQLGHAVGELVSCPFCLAQWCATALVAGQLIAPTVTRHITSTFTAVAGADVLHFAYSALERAEKKAQEET
ncbi:MAG TPA: DUF1360 domain-containing protein [Actinomycetales bacterium]|nr:DUF1360 domain-containing protein [Actinomycetales bacterium]